MGVPCSGCGRTYDVALFPFGRTIHCTCGRRVGIEPRTRRLEPEIRFAADAMLGRLARWLRLLGFDTTFDANVTDAELVRGAIETERAILTRDRGLVEQWWVHGILCIGSEKTFEQLREVFRTFDLGPTLQLFSRCSRCNTPLVPVMRADAGKRVPARAFESGSEFRECPTCARVYWQGSHTRRVREVVDRLLAGN